MAFVKTLPAALACLVLGAHFLRAGSLLLVVACLVLAILAFVPRRRPRQVVRIWLVFGVAVWLLTTLRIVGSRIDAGIPAGRSLAILLAVAAFTAWAAWLLPGVSATAVAAAPNDPPHSPESSPREES